jgi:hypothetical protein
MPQFRGQLMTPSSSNRDLPNHDEAWLGAISTPRCCHVNDDLTKPKESRLSQEKDDERDRGTARRCVLLRENGYGRGPLVGPRTNTDRMPDEIQLLFAGPPAAVIVAPISRNFAAARWYAGSSLSASASAARAPVISPRAGAPKQD